MTRLSPRRIARPRSLPFLPRPARAVVMFALTVAVLAPALAVRPGASALQEQPDGSFGFSDMKIFKFNPDVGPLAFGDVNGDGRTDVVVMNNQRAELVLLIQDPEAKGEETDQKRIRNPDGWRRQTILLTKRIHGVRVADADGDGQLDLLLHAPDTLEIRWGGGDGLFARTERIRLAETLPGSEAFVVQDDAAGDLEAFVLARKGVYHLSEIARSRAPKRSMLPGSAQKPLALFLVDLDRDGHRDLVILIDDKDFPYHARLRRPDGEFGPLQMLALPNPGAWTSVRRADTNDALVTVDRDRERFTEYGFEWMASENPLQLHSPEIHPLDPTGLEEPRMAVADIDGDGDCDIAVSHRADNTILLYLNEGGRLEPAPPAPTLRKIVGLAPADLDADGKPDVIVTSAEEKVVGTARFNGTSLSFPEILADSVKPVLAAPGAFGADGTPGLAALGGENGRKLMLLARDGASGRWALAAEDSALELSISNEPRDLVAHDFDRDGRDELILFVPFEVPRVFRWQDGKLVRVESSGTLEQAAYGAVTYTANGDLLVASGNHCRRIRLRDQLEVVVQVNGASGSSRIACALEAKIDGTGASHLVLVDQADGTVNVFGGDAEAPQLLQSEPGPYSTTAGGSVVDLDGDGRDEVVLLDPRFLAVLRSGAGRPALNGVFTHTNARPTGKYVDVAAGDLNGDGIEDLVVSDGAEHFIEIFKPGKEKRWELGLSFPVYESSTFRGGGSNVLEPRAVFVEDVTADDREDLVLLIHDRVIIYPQDAP